MRIALRFTSRREVYLVIGQDHRTAVAIIGDDWSYKNNGSRVLLDESCCK